MIIKTFLFWFINTDLDNLFPAIPVQEVGFVRDTEISIKYINADFFFSEWINTIQGQETFEGLMNEKTRDNILSLLRF